VFQITFIAKYGLGTCTSRIALGVFYGQSIVEPWQVDGSTAPLATSPHCLTDFLKQQTDTVRYAYDSACSRLRNLLETTSALALSLSALNKTQQPAGQIGRTAIFSAYDECMKLKLQLARLRRALARHQNQTLGRPPMDDESCFAMPTHALEECAELLLKSCILVTAGSNVPVRDVDEGAKMQDLIDLATALKFFYKFSSGGNCR